MTQPRSLRAASPARPGRWVLHLDMDAFFASVEQLTRPTLADRPVLVGGLGPRGVVAGASYQARRYGARSAMPMSQARRLVPVAVVLPPRIGLYRVLSEQVFDLVRQLGGVMEQISVDEAFLEPPDLVGAPPDEVERVAEMLRGRIRAEVGLTGSVGAGSGKQLAKIASTMAKPDGVRVVPHGTERDHLAPLPVRKLWGVGPVAEATLHRAGVETIGALAALSLGEVTALLGTAIGTELHGLAQGIDHRPVAERGEAKQVSAETTFDTDLSDLGSVRRAVAEMAEHAHRRLLTSGRAARTVTVKIRGGDFTTRSRSETAPTASTDLGTFTATAQRLTENALPESGVRLIGVSLSGLVDFIQPTLFEPDPVVASAASGAVVSPVATLAAPETRARESPGSHGPESQVAGSQVVGSQVVGSQVVGSQVAGSQGPESEVAGSGVAGSGVAGSVPEQVGAELSERPWRAGDDVRHAEFGHGWVQGSGHGRVTVRFETRTTGPGQARTFVASEPELSRADPTGSLL